MPILDAPFFGKMDTDSPDTKIPKGFHRDARNVIFRGIGSEWRAESAQGTTQIFNSLLPYGTNKTIGWLYDSNNQRLIFFNYNSNGNHAIYVYYTQLGSFQTILANGSGTQGDVLGFTTSYITSIDIYFAEPGVQAGEGDLLFYVDCLGRPTCLNISRYINNTYSLVKRNFIDLCKAPPRMPPRNSYENDFNIFINNLNNSVWQFRVRWVYDDNQKSVFSTSSIVALPNVRNLPYTLTVDTSTTSNNARISVYVPTGDADVIAVEIWGVQVVGANTSGVAVGSEAVNTANASTNNSLANYLLITSLNKAQLNINDNIIYRYLFYNDGTYIAAATVDEQLQLFDYAPQKANAQALLNGNVISYGGIVEGYDTIIPNFGLSASNGINVPRSTFNGVLFFASQSGFDSYGNGGDPITIYLTGTGLNDGLGNPQYLLQTTPTQDSPLLPSTLFRVACKVAASDIDNTFSYLLTTFVGQSVSDLLNSIATASLAFGFTITGTTPNSITIQKNGVVLHGAQMQNQNTDIGTNYTQYNNTHLAYPHQSAYQFGIQYFDYFGRTNGTSLTTLGKITTPDDVEGTTMPLITMQINNTPPNWAFYYSIVRSLNQTYNKHLFWVCNQTFNILDKNNNVIYAYIGISNMADYNATINATTNVVSYEFTPGDRIRFLQRFPLGDAGGPQDLPVFDYPIFALAVNPLVNGVVQTGNFITIVYPASDISPNFDFTGAEAYQNYKILIYSYAQHASSNANQVFFEFSRMYAIGNPGGVGGNPYHISPDISQGQALSLPDTFPAQILMDDGDYFIRWRNVPSGGIYYFPAGNIHNVTDLYSTIATYPTGGSIVTAEYSFFPQAGFDMGGVQFPYFVPFTVPTYATPNPYFYNYSGLPITLRLRGQAPVRCGANKNTNISFNARIVTPATATSQPIVALFSIPLGENLQSYVMIIDGYITVPPTAKVWLYVSNSTAPATAIDVDYFTLRTDLINNISIPITETSYSDQFQIVTNSNSRSSIYDPNAQQNYYSTLFRWSLADQLNTNINQTNRFYAQNFDEFAKQYGDIMRFYIWEKELRVFQKRKVGRTIIYGMFIKDQQGTSQLVTTDNIITQNNIQYFEGNYGLSDQPTSLVSSGYVNYFVDPVTGHILRLSRDGIIDLSELYRLQTFAGNNLPKYLNDYAYQFGGNAAVLGTFNFPKDRDGEAIFVLQGGTNGLLGNIVGQSVAFNERQNSWTSFYDFAPDGIVCCENDLYSFNNGALHIHNNTTKYCNYYGKQFTPSVTIIRNELPQVKKTWVSIAEVANNIWTIPYMYTDMFSYGGQYQQSNLYGESFALLESQYHASFLRDVNSVGGIINGDALKGQLLSVQLQPIYGMDFNYLSDVQIKFNISAVLNK